MSERLDLILREASGPEPNPPGLIRELKELIEKIVVDAAPDSSPSDINWVRPEDQQTKARRVQLLAMQKLEALDIERQRLLKERDEVRLKHKERMFELKIERFNAIVRALEVLTCKGIRLTARTTKRIEDALADISEPAGP